MIQEEDKKEHMNENEIYPCVKIHNDHIHCVNNKKHWVIPLDLFVKDS